MTTPSPYSYIRHHNRIEIIQQVEGGANHYGIELPKRLHLELGSEPQKLTKAEYDDLIAGFVVVPYLKRKGVPL